jgi:hypothetical protein
MKERRESRIKNQDEKTGSVLILDSFCYAEKIFEAALTGQTHLNS